MSEKEIIKKSDTDNNVNGTTREIDTLKMAATEDASCILNEKRPKEPETNGNGSTGKESQLETAKAVTITEKIETVGESSQQSKYDNTEPMSSSDELKKAVESVKEEVQSTAVTSALEDNDDNKTDGPVGASSPKNAPLDEKANTDEGKQVLPKWMVQDANAPLSPSPEATEQQKQKDQSVEVSPQKKGRGRRPVTEKKANITEQQTSSNEEPATQRPRRSTRTRIDYANPDAATVVASLDDEEPEADSSKRTAKSTRGRKSASGSGRGRKRKSSATSEEDDVRDDDEDDLDYGAKKKKRTAAGKSPRMPASAKRGRGRPSGTKNAEKGKMQFSSTGRRGKSNKNKDSDESEGEVVYDDAPSDKEQTSEEEPETRKVAITASSKAASVNKSPTKKRGRPSSRRNTSTGEKSEQTEKGAKSSKGSIGGEEEIQT